MRISFDYQIFLLQRYGGISRYFLGLGHEISRVGHDVEIHSPLNINKSLRISPILDKPSVYLPRYSTKLRMDKAATYFSSKSTEAYLRRKKPDILHQTYYGGDYGVDSKIPRFITVYDFIREVTSPENAMAIKKRKSFLAADIVICISESSQCSPLHLSNS